MSAEKILEKYSYSKVDCYKQCPFKFKLKYIDGHYTSSSSIATEFGTLIHSIEEEIANSIKGNLPINYAGLKNKLILKAAELEAKYPADFKTADKSGKNYQEKVNFYLLDGIYRLEQYMKAHPTYEIVGAEIPFSFEFEDRAKFSGYIDRVIKDQVTNKYICQDIKTWAEPKDEKELATPLQFVVYTLAIKNLYGAVSEDISCSYDLPICNLVQSAGTSGYMTRGIKKIRALLDSIDAGDYTPNPSPLCHWCEFCPTNPNQEEANKNLCPYHSLWTKENKKFDVAEVWEGLDKHQIILEKYIKKQEKK